MSLHCPPERGCVEDQPQQLRNEGDPNLPVVILPFDLLRLVEDDTAALRPNCVRGECPDAPAVVSGEAN